MCIGWKGRTWNDLNCVGQDVKPYSLYRKTTRKLSGCLQRPCIWTRNSVLMRLADSDSFSLREAQSESTSSMNMMLGLCSRANSNRLRTSLTHINCTAYKKETQTLSIVTQRRINFLSGNPERYSGWLLCTKNGSPTETRSAAIAVACLRVLRGAGMPVINACPEPADHVCCAVNLVTFSGQLQLIKFFSLPSDCHMSSVLS